MKPRDIVQSLMDQFGARFHSVHSDPVPGAQRQPGATLEGSAGLPEFMTLEGRDATLKQFIYWSAVTFNRWYFRGVQQSDEYRRGLAQLLLLSFPGAGKTTFLLMLPSLLRQWLERGDEECLSFLQDALYVSVALSPQQQEVPKLLLLALKALSGNCGTSCHLFFLLRVSDVKTAKLEREYGLDSTTASALRLLYAALTPLNPSAARLNYEQYLADMDDNVRQQLMVLHVLDFVRQASSLPKEVPLLIVPMIDEGNAAEGTIQPRSNPEITWLLEFISEIIEEMNKREEGVPAALVLPLTASTHYTTVNMTRLGQFSLTGQSLAVQLVMPVLSTTQRISVVQTLAARVAAFNERPEPEALSEPMKDALDMVGGSPRLVSFLMETIGGLDWKKGFDQVVAGVTAADVPQILIKVRNRAHQEVFWSRFLGEGDPASKKALLRMVVAHMLTDTPLRREHRLMGPSLAGPTVGDMEATGLVHCEVQGVDLLSKSTSNQRRAGMSVESAPSGNSSRASAPTSLPSKAPSGTSSEPSTPGGMLSLAEMTKTVSRGATGITVEVEPSKADSPSKAALLDDDVSCASPSSSPGSEIVRLSASPIAVQYMMRELNLMQDKELSVFSLLADRESAMDKEVVDAQMLAIKLEAHAVKGAATVSLQELFTGLKVPAEHATKRFLLPRGHLTVAQDGQRQAHRLSLPQIREKVESCRKAIVQSRDSTAAKDWQDNIVIGFIGVGNYANDSMVVLVDEQGSAWTVVMQSKQTTAATPVTVKTILCNLEADLQAIFQLPVLTPEWASWHRSGRDTPLPTGPCQQLSGSVGPPHPDAASEQLLPAERLLYIFVSDGSFSDKQDKISSNVLAARHPWLKWAILVAYKDVQAFYTRIGAFKRETMRRAVISKLA